ncbi:hypothetical protein C8R46DRAFT_1032250 [Mycena filopes]|nr:hypothetical protein C8R46DRAFT_1032250 [Mycena filopes]
MYSSPISSCLVSVVSLFSFVLSSIHLDSTSASEKDQLSAGSTPSRVSGDPTRTTISQDKAGLALTTFLILLSLGVASSAAYAWTRSPGSGRLHREPEQDPPPPADEDDGQEHNDIAEDNADQDSDGGDDDPQEDGGIDGGENGGADDGMATAAAPAPEDPPPPAGGIEEDGDGFRRPFVADGGFFWLVLFILANGLLNVVFRTRASRGTEANGKRSGVSRSATIPGLLQRLPDFKYGPLQGSLHRQPLPIQVALALGPDVPTLVRKVADRASAFRTHTVVPDPAHRFLVWRRAYLLLVGLPGLGFAIAVLRLLGTNGNLHIPADHEQELVPQADDDDPLPTPPTTPRRHRPPPAPHPSPISPPRLRPRAPLPYRDKATQETCDRMIILLRQRTITRTAPERKPQDGDAEGRERNAKICAVQRRVWGLILELRREGAWADDTGDAVGDEEEAAM